MRRKNDTFAQVIVGVFMVTILLLLGYFTIVISGVDMLAGRQKKPLTATFAHVGGLREHDNVMFRGTKVGTVERVIVTASNLVVVAQVDERVILRQGYRISVCNQSMLGGNYLQLEEGEGEPVDFAQVELRGDAPRDWMHDMSKIAQNLKDLTTHLEVGGIVTNLEEASRSVKVVASRLERGEGLFGKLVSGDDALYEDIRATAANARELSEKINRKQLCDDLSSAIGDFRKVCAGLNHASENIAKASEGVDLRSTVAKVDVFVDGATALATNLNAVAQRLRQGEGTLGRLTVDDRFYEELDGLIRDCRQIIDNYRDTTPISTFTSLATGAL